MNFLPLIISIVIFVMCIGAFVTYTATDRRHLGKAFAVFITAIVCLRIALYYWDKFVW